MPARLHRLAAMSPLQVLRLVDSSLSGLDEPQAQLRAQRDGENGPAAQRPYGWPQRLRRAMVNPFVLILFCLAAVSAATEDLPAAAVIITLAAISCVLQVRQEQRADQAVATLRAMVARTATVVRRARPGGRSVAREVPTDHLVPGDVVRLAAGELVPADIRLLRSGDLMVNQALLTGESLPAFKHATLDGLEVHDAAGHSRHPATLFDDPRLCLLGSMVIGGSGTGVVVGTGTDTYVGETRRSLPPRGETAFDRGVRGVSRTLIRVMLAAAPAVLAVNALARENWPQAFLFAMSVAVGLTPEMLPVVTTTVLARAAALLRARGLIVKRLPAIHNLGAMDVLCTDKTGTLTQNRTTVACHLDPAGVSDRSVLGWAALNSQINADRLGPLFCDPLDEALIRRADELGLRIDDGLSPVEAFGFDVARRRATVVVRRTAVPGADTVITKGAVEEVLDCCTWVRSGGVDRPLSPDERLRLDELAASLYDAGVRLLAVAIGDRYGRRGAVGERDMTLIGFIGLRDDLRNGVPSALAALAGQGVSVKLVTGDHPQVAARICREAGLPPGRPVRGSELDPLDDAALADLAERTTIFARVDPHQKARIVTALRSRGHTVGYLGDGLNDASALRAADVGVCVENAAPVARASADVIMASKDLATLSGALGLSRRAFVNIIKHIKITVSSNVGNVTAVVAAGALLPFLPMLPLQILVQNLLFDVSQLCLAFDRADDGGNSRPRTFDSGDLLRFVVCFGILNSLADLATFAALRHVLGAHLSPSAQVLFHTGWFVENLLTQVLAVHLLRSDGSLRRWSWASRPVLVASLAIVVASLALTAGPFAGILGFRALPPAYFGWLAVVLAAFCVTTLAGKFAYQRAVRSWL
ncbi:magnesium-translocating P-type ATPase [Rugosimonospora africana]|uniref:Magnesium-transporting ATPase, P-type 1 n=1 Tax=Rugosimonospora africana TaxID=556532 RepID=A0A8J3VT23_9ACTN|nr:magnesium-translocating P-type ATPase [Rugosimonospora africana]GIH17967.1 magnesium-translocating P-type ATPase [Rugosimonospora africana]